MPVYFIPEDLFFPHPLLAEEPGILGIGGDLSPDRLLLAYRFGIFPWYSPDEPILWWFPDPRCVLYPDHVKVQKSMRPYFNSEKYHVTADTCFGDVIEACQIQKRSGQNGTWIHDDIKSAYTALHAMGYAHSVEVWEKDELIGGLYGVSLGKVFFGESMFSMKNNASKFALICLAYMLKQFDFKLIDCQQDTPHLRKLGASLISKEDFYDILRANVFSSGLRHAWTSYFSSIENWQFIARKKK